MALVYIAAGINHFINPAMYLSIMPAWLPQKLLLSNFSGFCEICFGVMLIPKFTRQYAACGIIVLLIAVYPANIQMSINYYKEHNPYFWLTLVRLPLQFLLIWWAYTYTRKNV